MKELLHNQYIQSLLEFIYPNLCLGCGSYVDDEAQICAQCEKRIEKIKLPYCLHCMQYMENDIVCSFCDSDSFPLFSYANYGGAIREIIIQYKFKNITTPAEIFAKRLYEFYGNLLLKFEADFLIPIPLHKSRESTRGYNQAFLLADCLSRELSIPVDDSILVRDKKRKPQAKLTIAERIDNIHSVFSVIEKSESEQRCILVDDVVTTGNTVFEATKELEHAGYKVVAVVSIAHAFKCR